MSPLPDGVVAPAGVAEALVRRAAWPTGITLVACCTVGAWVDGVGGLVGAIVGSVALVVFFGLDLIVMRYTAQLDPVITFGLVMMEYLGKIIALALFLGAFRTTTAFNTRVMGATLAVGTVVFLAALTVAFTRIKTYATDPDGWPTDGSGPGDAGPSAS